MMITTLELSTETEVLAPSPITAPSEIDSVREKIRQLAEWMLEGIAKGYGQAYWTLHDYKAGEHSFCALGMALLGMAGSMEQMDQHNYSTTVKLGQKVGINLNRVTVKRAYRRHWQGPLTCLENAITELNDYEHWTIQQIAIWLFSLEYNEKSQVWQAPHDGEK